MSNFARIIDGSAVDVSNNPEENFHAEIAKDFVLVPDFVEKDWTVDEWGNWSEPANNTDDQGVATVDSKKVSPVEFKLLFTSEERIKIKTSADPVVLDFFEIVNDPRLTVVDLGLQSTIGALGYLVDNGYISQDRKAAILTGALL